MNPIQAVKTCLTRYTTTSGRASRAEYWWWIAFIFLVTYGLAVAEGIFITWESLLGPVVVFIVATLLPTFAVTARRLHDTNWPAWWAVPSALTVHCSLFGMAFGEEALFYYLGEGIVVYGLGALVHLVVLVQAFRRGTQGTNRFGPEPLGAGDADRQPNDGTS